MISTLILMIFGCSQIQPVEDRQPSSIGVFEGLVRFTGSPRHLTEREKAFFTSNPLAMQIVREADKYTDEAVGEICGNDRGDNEVNAFKHYVLACYIGFHIGRKKALDFLTIHEGRPEICEKDTSKLCWIDEQRMDFYNNLKGVECAEDLKREFPNESPFYRSLGVSKKLRAKAKSALQAGELSVMVLQDPKYAPGCNRFHGLYPNSRHKDIELKFTGWSRVPQLRHSLAVPTEEAGGSQR